MRRFPAGVAIVTVALDGERYAITVGSLVSLSLEPPLVGMSIGLQSSIYEQIRRAGRWVVNVLAHDQTELAQHFARSGMPPLVAWTSVTVRQRDGVPEPLIDGALAWLECTTVGEHAAGDHVIFIGAVLSIELGRDEPGLTYVRGAYLPA